jgi:hypothetical protein
MIGDGVNDAPALRLRMLEVQSVRVQMLRWSLPESHVSPKGYTLSQASGRRQHAGNSRKGLFTPNIEFLIFLFIENPDTLELIRFSRCHCGFRFLD